MRFDFCEPITWSDIISVLSLIVAFGVAIVAICGNRQSQKQFRANMKAQERALNLSLFEKRMDILEYFGKKEFTIVDIVRLQGPSLDRRIESFRMLFSAQLVSEYERLYGISEQISAIKRKIGKLQMDFLRDPSVNECAGAKPFEVWEQMKKTGADALSGKDVEQFREMSHRLCQGLENDYADLLFNLHSFQLEYSDKNKEFLAHMEEEIQSSIKKPEAT